MFYQTNFLVILLVINFNKSELMDAMHKIGKHQFTPSVTYLFIHFNMQYVYVINIVTTDMIHAGTQFKSCCRHSVLWKCSFKLR